MKVCLSKFWLWPDPSNIRIRSLRSESDQFCQIFISLLSELYQYLPELISPTDLNYLNSIILNQCQLITIKRNKSLFGSCLQCEYSHSCFISAAFFGDKPSSLLRYQNVHPKIDRYSKQDPLYICNIRHTIQGKQWYSFIEIQVTLKN